MILVYIWKCTYLYVYISINACCVYAHIYLQTHTHTHTHTYTHIYIYVCVCLCMCVKNFRCRFRERKKCFKTNKSTKRFVIFLKDLFLYFVLIYVYVSSLLLSSENIYSTRPCKLDTHRDLNSLLLAFV